MKSDVLFLVYVFIHLTIVFYTVSRVGQYLAEIVSEAFPF